MTETRTFAGLPIDGEITAAVKRANQLPAEQLAPLMQALLDDEAIVSFGWAQYTPYFNDGEPCVFSANSVWVRTTWDGEVSDGDRYKFEITDTHPTLGTRRWDDAHHKFVDAPGEHYDEARYERCRAVGAAIDGGHFDDALIDLFGDHANIAVTREGITVEFYEHD